ncbi:hypothetical protein [Tamaricihabitans halophyticus]|uniref:hypothetical protein n=1 Tax=Tamaricihabitans halophyticus TaxID=1262583 RepID=UPI00104CE7F2|nr:hypothetical protein [Tamaricihabitans halophyticus]
MNESESVAGGSCPRCGWPVAEQQIVSSHASSLGQLRYQTCVCGITLVVLAGDVVAAVSATA